MKNIFKILSIYLLLNSCIATHPCMDSVLMPVFTGFNKPEDLTAIVFRVFKQGDNFREVKDSLYIHEPLHKIGTVSGDTLHIWLNGDYTRKRHYYVMAPGFDWEIYLPELNRTFRITDIINKRTEGKGIYCVNEITSCSIDGKTTYPVYFDKIGFPSGFIINIEN